MDLQWKMARIALISGHDLTTTRPIKMRHIHASLQGLSMVLKVSFMFPAQAERLDVLHPPEPTGRASASIALNSAPIALP